MRLARQAIQAAVIRPTIPHSKKVQGRQARPVCRVPRVRLAPVVPRPEVHADLEDHDAALERAEVVAD